MKTLRKKSTKSKAKIVRNIFLGFILTLVIFFIIILITHRYCSEKEYDMLSKAGYINPVSVGNYNLNTCVYGNEDGKHTLVGIAGMGVHDFAVSIRPFMEHFDEANRIVVIDRAGYGMSDDTNEKQTVERIVSDYRQALINAGCEPPYVLVAHSLGGNYATHWVNTYPDEIEGIVYLDPTYILGDPSYIEDHPGEEVWWEQVSNAPAILQKLGLARVIIATSKQKPWISVNSSGQEELKKAFWEHSICTTAQNSESACTKENMIKTSKIMKENLVPKLYIDAAYYTMEDMKEYYGTLYNNGIQELFADDINPQNKESMAKLWEVDGKMRIANYEKFIKNYVKNLGNCKYINIPGDHYIYEYKPDEVAKEVEEFIEQL